MKIATIFSVIGAAEMALKKLNTDHEIIFACDNGERYVDIDSNVVMKENNNELRKKVIDKIYLDTKKINYVEQSYINNFDISKDKFYQDVKFIDGLEYNNKIDLFVGGSPCQSFSISGNRKGLEDTRGTLFYEFARLTKEIQPKVFIYENVPGILSHDKGQTWNVINNVFSELGYDCYSEILNSKSFGIPQNRKRVFVVGFRSDLNIHKFEFPKGFELLKKVKDFLVDNVEKKYYHGTKGFAWVTNPKNLKKRVSINSDISRTQTANQQFNWCGDMIFEPLESNLWAKKDEKVFIGKYLNKLGVCRKLTPRECLRLMEFSDEFKIVVPDQKIYRQCGNSIVVNVLENLISEILTKGVI